MIALYGVVILVASKLLWYNGLRHVQVLKATSLIMTTPVIGVLVAAFFFREMPTIFQIGGFAATVCGLFLLTRRQDAL